VAEVKLLIGGELVPGAGEPLAIENPALGEVFETVGLPSEEQVDAAIAAARDGARAWAATPALEAFQETKHVHIEPELAPKDSRYPYGG
jgi:acyl-CoA reductase-like NAD-dependent aldehyde dehydrogenase